MKKVFMLSLTLCAGAFAPGAFAQDTTVRWRGMEGVITAPGTDNAVSQIHAGAGPWTTRGGSATINLASGEGSFDVEGLVMNGGNASGTPGAVTAVIGTLVCNPNNAGGVSESIADTPSVSLSSEGNAELSFKLNVSPTCNAPVFLIRVASGRWIATATRPVKIGNSR